jgi:hypothetical protein
MGRRKRIKAKRCVECRRKYRPDVSVGAAQKTCSARCRCARRKRSAKAWREASVETYRERERERQRRHRERSKGVSVEGVSAVEASMSRTGVILEVSELTRLVKDIGDKVEALSRTGLARKVRILSGARAEKRGQEGTGISECHGPG